MNEKAVRSSLASGLRRAFWALSAVPLACIALGSPLACGGGADSSAGELDNIQDATETVLAKAQVPTDLVSTQICQHCEPKVECEQRLVSCDPPVFVNGREIKCLEEVCTERVVCTPCSEDGVIDGLDGIVPSILDHLGGSSPIDPSPFESVSE